MENELLAHNVKKKGKTLKGCIAAILMWSFKNQQTVDKDIIKAAGVSASKVTLGIPGMARAKKIKMRKQLRWITLFTFGAFIMVGYYFFKLERITQIVAVVFLGLTLLYTLPFFPNKKNARNWAGVKIYIVAFCWVGATVFLPLLNADMAFNANIGILSLQRFVLIFVLILIFEIIDLRFDNPNLRTVPQQIGMKKTKILGFSLLFLFCGLEIFNINSNFNIQFMKLKLDLYIAIAIVITLFLAFANEKRSKYYTSFWVESVPIVWWLFIYITIQ